MEESSFRAETKADSGDRYGLDAVPLLNKSTRAEEFLHMLRAEFSANVIDFRHGKLPQRQYIRLALCESHISFCRTKEDLWYRAGRVKIRALRGEQDFQFSIDTHAPLSAAYWARLLSLPLAVLTIANAPALAEYAQVVLSNTRRWESCFGHKMNWCSHCIRLSILSTPYRRPHNSRA